MRRRAVIQRDTNADRNIRAARDRQQLSNDRCAIPRVAGRCGNQLHIQLGALQQKDQRPNIVDIKTDIRIQNNGCCHGQAFFIVLSR